MVTYIMKHPVHVYILLQNVFYKDKKIHIYVRCLFYLGHIPIFIITCSLQVDINDIYYHNYTHRQDHRKADTLAIWFEGIQSSLDLFNVDMHFPSLI